MLMFRLDQECDRRGGTGLAQLGTTRIHGTGAAVRSEDAGGTASSGVQVRPAGRVQDGWRPQGRASRGEPPR